MSFSTAIFSWATEQSPLIGTVLRPPSGVRRRSCMAPCLLIERGKQRHADITITVFIGSAMPLTGVFFCYMYILYGPWYDTLIRARVLNTRTQSERVLVVTIQGWWSRLRHCHSFVRLLVVKVANNLRSYPEGDIQPTHGVTRDCTAADFGKRRIPHIQ